MPSNGPLAGGSSGSEADTHNSDVAISEDDSSYTLRLANLIVTVRKDSGRIEVYGNGDNQADSNQPGGNQPGIHQLDNRPDPKQEPFLAISSIEWTGKRQTTCTIEAHEDSHYYGLGEKTGFLDKKGERYDMWNSDVYEPHVPDIDALYQSIPFLIHYRYDRPAAGILLDDPGRTTFDMGGKGNGNGNGANGSSQATIRSENGNLDLYVMSGPGLKDVVQRYAALTGRPPMPPRWAIGYQQSRYSYMSQEELLTVARTMREKRIPCDVLYLDIHYMEEYKVFTWDTERFPDPRGMIAELAEMGFKVVPIVDPGVKKDPRYPVYAEGVRNGHFCAKLEGDLFVGDVWPGPSAFTDYTDEAASKWWGDLHRFYIDQGIRGIWNDMNEPSVFGVPSKTMDLDVVHRNGGNPKTHGEWHNLYGMLMSKATYEGMVRNLNGERPFVLTRAGYAGIQRYATVWTGDNRSYWEHMAMSIPMVLNLGLSGVAFAGPDIGGFSHNTTGELLARWTQLGALYPFCRNHSAIDTIHQEPWLFGERVEAICRDYLSLRYKLMPYLYSLFYEATSTGLPLVRPLLLEYPQDRNVSNLCDQFLLGRDLLVAPVLRPGAPARSVYLPEGVWYDYWTGEKHEGGRSILAETPLETMPVYVRAGAIIPEQSLTQHANERPEGSTKLRVYSGGTGSFSLYEDDGLTYAYESGAFRLREFEWRESPTGKVLTSSVRSNGYSERGAELEIVVEQVDEAPASVALSGGKEQVNWTYDGKNRRLILSIDAEGDFLLTIKN
ncbi:DUF5110 domain-containing protein [Cohnella sp. AR92]|nr:DUF5110 domain-containing protein [Cohnella sp. AR92]